MTGIAVRNEGVFDEYDEDEMLMVMSLAEYWKIINRLKRLDDRMETMRKVMGNLVNQGFFMEANDVMEAIEEESE